MCWQVWHISFAGNDGRHHQPQTQWAWWSVAVRASEWYYHHESEDALETRLCYYVSLKSPLLLLSNLSHRKRGCEAGSWNLSVGSGVQVKLSKWHLTWSSYRLRLGEPHFDGSLSLLKLRSMDLPFINQYYSKYEL